MDDEAPVEPEAPESSFKARSVEQAIGGLAEDRRAELYAVMISTEFHSGPLPSPKALAGYEVVSSGLAKQIVDMATRQQEHDIEMEVRTFGSESRYRVLTLSAATIVVLAMVCAATWLGVNGHETSASVIGAAGGLALVAGAILKGRDLYGNKPSTPLKPSKSPRTRTTGTPTLPRAATKRRIKQQ